MFTFHQLFDAISRGRQVQCSVDYHSAVEMADYNSIPSTMVVGEERIIVIRSSKGHVVLSDPGKKVNVSSSWLQLWGTEDFEEFFVAVLLGSLPIFRLTEILDQSVKDYSGAYKEYSLLKEAVLNGRPLKGIDWYAINQI